VRSGASVLLPVIAASLVAGCASFSADGGMGLVTDLARPEVKAEARKIDTAAASAMARAETQRRLTSVLFADAAVQIALLNNKGLQAAYNDLGIAEAQKIAASLPPNPSFSLSHLSTPVELDIEGRIAGDILAVATLPARADLAAERFRQAQLWAVEETLHVGVEARRNYYCAVASRQLVTFLSQATSAAETSAKIAKELGETGAMNKLDQAREQAFYVELEAQLATAEQQAASDRETLIRSLGLWDNHSDIKLPGGLPALPKRPKNSPIEAEAVRRRVDLQIARNEVDALAKTYGLTNATRFVDLLDVSGVSRTQRELGVHGSGGGVELDVQVPVFDFGEVRVREAAETYSAAVNQLTEKAVNVRSEARDAYRVYRSAYDIAIHYRDQVLPLREIITDETTLRYGAMQIDVFSLLTEARQRLAVQVAAIEAQRNFWLASVRLSAAVAGGGAGGNTDRPRPLQPHLGTTGSE
jgi:outer membrane protein TolC